MRILEEINSESSEACSISKSLEDPTINDLKRNELVPNQSGVYFSLFLLIFYMIIANVLLVNLLIAMFK